MTLYEAIPPWIREILDHLKTRDMCIEAVRMEPRSLAFVPGRFKTQGMCNEAVAHNPYSLDHLPDHFKAQEMCNEWQQQPSSIFRYS